MAEIIKTDGTRTATTPANGEYFTLEEMQAAVGGMVEIVELDDKQSMILNEEGKLLDLPYNEEADNIFTNILPPLTISWVMCFYVKTN